jgi:ABC-type dipeptide/oligopeptide/nickel transport system ATPase component
MLINASQGEFFKKEEEISFDEGRGCAYYARCEQRKGYCCDSMPRLVGSKEHMVACFPES